MVIRATEAAVCRVLHPGLLKDVDFSPDGTYFVLVASGFVPQPGGLFSDVCDAAARFETNVQSPTAPTWIN